MQYRAKIFLLIGAIAVLAAVFVFFERGKKRSVVIPSQAPFESPLPSFTPLPALPFPPPEATQQALQEYSKLVFPEISSRKKANAGDLPSEIATLIGTDQENFSVGKLTYVGKQTGFAIRYTAAKPMHETYLAFLEATKTWTNHTAVEAFNAALLERETTSLKMRIEFTTDGGSTSDVAMQTIGK